MSGTHSASDSALGVGIEFVGTSMSVVGLALQKWAMMHHEALPPDERALTYRWRWCCALALFVAGQLVEATSQAFASQSLLSSVSNVSLITNAFVSRYLFGEPLNVWPVHRGWQLLREWDMGAIGVILAGTALAVYAAPSLPDDDYTADEMEALFSAAAYVSFLTLTLVIIVASSSFLLMAPRQTQSNSGGLAYGVLAAANGSLVTTFAKVSVLLLDSSFDGHNQFTRASSWAFVAALVVAAVANLAFLNMGLARYEALVVIPVYYVINTVCAVTAGLLFYGTYSQFTAGTASLFALGQAVSLSGVVVFTQRKHDPQEAVERFTERASEISRSFSVVSARFSFASARSMSLSSRASDGPAARPFASEGGAWGLSPGRSSPVRSPRRGRGSEAERTRPLLDSC